MGKGRGFGESYLPAPTSCTALYGHNALTSHTPTPFTAPQPHSLPAAACWWQPLGSLTRCHLQFGLCYSAAERTAPDLAANSHRQPLQGDPASWLTAGRSKPRSSSALSHSWCHAAAVTAHSTRSVPWQHLEMSTVPAAKLLRGSGHALPKCS